MTITLYGIKNCDTMKKARTWLADRDIEYAFHDYKVAGIDAKHLERWCKQKGWETVLNKAGTTFKQLDAQDKADLDERKAIALMLKHPSMIKRPVLVLAAGEIVIGFKPDHYAAIKEFN